MDFEEFINRLPRKKQIQLALKLIKIALPIWENLGEEHSLSYRDCVAALEHSVDKTILKRSIDCLEAYAQSSFLQRILTGNKQLLRLIDEFDDPIIALQDDDWTLPDPALNLFYSVFNLIEFLLGKEGAVFGHSLINISISQAISSIVKAKRLSKEEIKSVLEEFVT